jgi:hypothetical protein
VFQNPNPTSICPTLPVKFLNKARARLQLVAEPLNQGLVLEDATAEVTATAVEPVLVKVGANAGPIVPAAPAIVALQPPSLLVPVL